MKTVADVIKKIAIHTALAYLAMFLGYLVTAAIILIIPGAGQTSTIIGRALDAPFWLPEVACRAILGWLARRRFAVNLAGLGIIVPIVLLTLDIVYEGLPMRRYTPLVNIYFSSDSGGTEGLYQIIFTVPLYAAVAYALGALAAKRIKTDPPEAKSAHGASLA